MCVQASVATWKKISQKRLSLHVCASVYRYMKEDIFKAFIATCVCKRRSLNDMERKSVYRYMCVQASIATWKESVYRYMQIIINYLALAAT